MNSPFTVEQLELTAKLYSDAIKKLRSQEDEGPWMRPMMNALLDLRVGLKSVREQEPRPEDVNQVYFDNLVNRLRSMVTTIEEVSLQRENLFEACQYPTVFGGRDFRYAQSTPQVGGSGQNDVPVVSTGSQENASGSGQNDVPVASAAPQMMPSGSGQNDVPVASAQSQERENASAIRTADVPESSVNDTHSELSDSEDRRRVTFQDVTNRR